MSVPATRPAATLPARPRPDHIVASDPTPLTTEHGGRTAFVRHALAKTQWPAVAPLQPIVRLGSPQTCETFTSPLATFTDLDDRTAATSIATVDATATTTTTNSSTATTTAYASPADLTAATESPVEGCFTESVGSPASARDFLTSPSLFDDCDFEFEADGQPLFPLFPGTTFDSQVNEARAVGADASRPEADHCLADQHRKETVSPLPSFEMGNVQSLQEDQVALERADELDHRDESKRQCAARQTMIAELRQQGLSCYMAKPNDASATSLQDDLSPQNYDTLDHHLYDPASQLMPKAEGEADVTDKLAAGLQGETLYAIDSNTRQAEANSLAHALEQLTSSSTQAEAEEMVAEHLQTRQGLVPYFEADQLMNTSGSTLSMAMPSFAPIATPARGAEPIEECGSASTDVKPPTLPSTPRETALATDPPAESRVGPVRRKKAKKARASPVTSRDAGPVQLQARTFAAKGSSSDISSTVAECSAKGGRFQCEVCNKYFDRAFNLKTHMFTHEDPNTRAKNFICPDASCRKAFARKHDMKRHHSTVHLRTVKRSSKKSPNQPSRNDDQG